MAPQPACRTAGGRTLAQEARTCICTLIRERNFGRTSVASFKYGPVIWRWDARSRTPTCVRDIVTALTEPAHTDMTRGGTERRGTPGTSPAAKAD